MDEIKKIKKQKKIIKIWQISILVLFILLWQILSSKEIINSFIWSSPYLICKEFISLLLTKVLFKHIFTTLIEIIITFILSIFISFIIAILMYKYNYFAKIIDPYLTVMNSLPKVAIGPIIIIIAGANIKSIILMALFINLIASIINIYNGFQNTNKIKIKLFKSFGASDKDILYKLVIPSSYTNIISNLKITISLTLIGVITGEFLISKSGIGYLIIYGTQVFNLTLVYLGIIILLIISFILYKLVILLEKNLKI